MRSPEQQAFSAHNPLTSFQPPLESLPMAATSAPQPHQASFLKPLEPTVAAGPSSTINEPSVTHSNSQEPSEPALNYLKAAETPTSPLTNRQDESKPTASNQTQSVITTQPVALKVSAEVSL